MQHLGDFSSDVQYCLLVVAGVADVMSFVCSVIAGVLFMGNVSLPSDEAKQSKPCSAVCLSVSALCGRFSFFLLLRCTFAFFKCRRRSFCQCT